jgi:hypothetical protein
MEYAGSVNDATRREAGGQKKGGEAEKETYMRFCFCR